MSLTFRCRPGTGGASTSIVRPLVKEEPLTGVGCFSIVFDALRCVVFKNMSPLANVLFLTATIFSVVPMSDLIWRAHHPFQEVVCRRLNEGLSPYVMHNN